MGDGPHEKACPKDKNARFAQGYRRASPAHPLWPGRPDRGPRRGSDGRRGRRQFGRPGPPKPWKRKEDILRSGGLSRRQGPGDAVGTARRHRFGRSRRFRKQAGFDLPLQCVAWPGFERLWRAHGWFRHFAAGRHSLSAQGRAAACHLPRPGRRQAGSGCARVERLRHLLPGPAHGYFRRLGRGQIDIAGHAGPQFQRRRHRHRPDRRTRPRSEGIHRG